MPLKYLSSAFRNGLNKLRDPVALAQSILRDLKTLPAFVRAAFVNGYRTLRGLI